MSILLTDGDWRISRSEGYNEVWLDHKCLTWGQAKVWYFYGKIFPGLTTGRKCNRCQKTPPEGLLATLWFLKVGE